MALSDPQRTITSIPTLSNSQIKDESLSVIIPSKRDIFLSTYQHQRFSLSNSMMHYIAKNPKNSDIYQKMIKICKYFFIINPILVIDYLSYNRNGWQTCVNKTWENIDINRISAKFWITGQLHVSPANVTNDSIAFSIIPKIYQCDFKRLSLKNQIFSLNEFMFLCSSVEGLSLQRVTVKNYDGTVVAFENIIEQLPNVKRISYTFTTPSNNTSKNTLIELWKIPHLSNCSCFYLCNVPEDVDIESFYSFMKKNKHTRVYLWYSDQISEEYKTRLEAIVDEIIETKNHKYKTPFIEFHGLDREKFRKLYDIFCR